MSGTISELNYSHCVCFPSDVRRHEIIDEEHYVNPAPSTYHQTLSRRIQFALYSAIELDRLTCGQGNEGQGNEGQGNEGQGKVDKGMRDKGMRDRGRWTRE